MPKNITIAKLDIDTQALTESMQKTEKDIEKLTEKQDKLIKKGKEGSDKFRENAAELNMLAAAYKVQSDALAAMGMTFDDYKQQVADSFEQINIFNGGLGGFISRAQEAGGVGPLVKGAFGGMASGIGGMTKSALAFMATPLGAALTAITALLSPIIDYLTNTEEGIDKVTAVTRPLQSVFEALSGVFQQIGKFLFEAFTNPKKSMEELYEFVKQNLINRFTAFGTILEGIVNMDFKKISNGVLQMGTGVEDVIGKTQKAAEQTGRFFEEALKRGQMIDSLQKQLDKSQGSYTKRMSEISLEMDKQKGIANDTNMTHAQREKAAIKAIELAKEENRLAIDRMDTEIKLAELKMKENGIDSKEKQQLEEMKAKRDEAAASYKNSEEELYKSIDAIRQDAHDKEMKRRRQALDDALSKQKQQLALYEAENSSKAKTLDQAIAFENDVANKKLDILKNELKLKKISQTEYRAAEVNIENDKLQHIAELYTSHSKAQLDLELAKSKSLTENAKELTAELVKQENERLDEQYKMKLKHLALEMGISENRINMTEEEARNGTLIEKKFYSETLAYQTDLNAKKQANNNNFERQETERQNKENERINKEKAEIAALELERNTSEYEQKIMLEDERHAAEVAKYDQWKLDGLLSEKQYTDYIKALDEETARNKQRLAIQNAQTQLGTMQNVANALTEAFGQSKDLAIAQATMNAGQAILSIWSGTISGNPLIDTAIKTALTATTAIKTGKQIKEIQSAKKPESPKFSMGGLLPVGGKRHSQGGTLFTGADGTQFEAEQGELIGVMNRNAARHFMAFNNAFPSGGASAPNYFAGGGIVSREIAQQTLNTDELALKIAQANSQLPAPVVAIQDIITQGNSYVKVRDAANF